MREGGRKQFFLALKSSHHHHRLNLIFQYYHSSHISRKHQVIMPSISSQAFEDPMNIMSG
uniref:Uncharacterized protein n=1 Tax=Helianthus annuus TaxID=4232 RepID=A0A251RMH9_HELAN